MLFTINDIAYDFVPIKDFRAAYHLPQEFGVSLFGPKDYTGLGRIDRAGAELNALRERVLAAMPERMRAAEWLAFVPHFTRVFETQLYAINPRVGLRDVEVDFAVSGFSDGLQTYAYALARAHAAREPLPDFRRVYTEWLNGTLKVFAQVYPYPLDGQPCQVQIVAHAYGRIGLLIHAAGAVQAVYDPALACPAEGFMTALLAEVAARMAGHTLS
jgi:hypothetical protein